jgi:hypothetical protein
MTQIQALLNSSLNDSMGIEIKNKIKFLFKEFMNVKSRAQTLEKENFFYKGSKSHQNSIAKTLQIATFLGALNTN